MNWNVFCLLNRHINRTLDGRPMPDSTITTFSHVKPADTAWRSEGLRHLFLYNGPAVAGHQNGRRQQPQPFACMHIGGRDHHSGKRDAGKRASNQPRKDQIG